MNHLYILMNLRDSFNKSNIVTGICLNNCITEGILVENKYLCVFSIKFSANSNVHPHIHGEKDLYKSALTMAEEFKDNDIGKTATLALSRNENTTWKIIQANPSINWCYDILSMNPNITWKIVKRNPDKPWNYKLMSNNPNITWKIVQANPNKGWSYTTLSKNPNITWDIIKQNYNKPWDYSMVAINPNVTLEIMMSEQKLLHDVLIKNPNISYSMIWDKVNGLAGITKRHINHNPNITWKELYYTNIFDMNYAGTNDFTNYNAATLIQKVYRKWSRKVYLESITTIKGMNNLPAELVYIILRFSIEDTKYDLHNMTRDTNIVIDSVVEEYKDINYNPDLIKVVRELYVDVIRNSVGEDIIPKLRSATVEYLENKLEAAKKNRAEIFNELIALIDMLYSNLSPDKKERAISGSRIICESVLENIGRFSCITQAQKEFLFSSITNIIENENLSTQYN
jgi:hypothetical protein